jgi:hypothetical protein
VRSVAFADSMRAAAAQAGERAGWDEHCLGIADRRILLRFAGPALTDAFLPALAHLETEAQPGPDPDLEVLLWDSRSTGVPLPQIPWRREDVGILGEVEGYNDERVRTALTPTAPMLSVFDRQAGAAVLWVRDAAELTWSERANPLRVILHWGLTGEGCRLAHAGAVGTRRGGVLVTGPSGAGKSTVSMACLAAGFDFAGDDHVLLTRGADGPVAHALYGTAKLHWDTQRRVSGLAGAVVNHADLGDAKATRPLHHDEKLVADVGRWRAERLRDVAVRAVLIPRIVARPESRTHPVRPGDALRALAPSTILQLPRVGEGAGLAELAETMRGVPAHVLELGTDTAAVPTAVAELLEDVAAA